MAVPISMLDRFKVETQFGDGCVVQSTYEWEFSERRLKESSTWTEVKLLGAGAFGSVWLEQKKEGGQLRAVKKLRRESLRRTGFSQELVALVTLADHKHLFVEFFGWYESSREIFLAMEYIKYGDLSQYMQDRETARVEAREITSQILEGLKILHGESICHRDLKPQNILVASRDPIWVKIADFGVSKRTNNTVLRTKCGTQGYLAPECHGLISRKNRIGEEFTYALDLWALGCVVHELFTAQIPFLESDDDDDDMSGLETSLDMSDAIIDMQSLCDYCRGEIDFPSHILHAAHVSKEGIAFIESLLVPNPIDRPTASSALQHPWLANTGYTSDWYKELERDFLGLGINLDLGRDRASMRQLRSADIAQVLPTTESLGVLLQQAFSNGYYTAALMLLLSPSRQRTDPSGTHTLLEEVVWGGRIEAVKLILSVKAALGFTTDDVLIMAICEGHIEIVQLLIDNETDFNSRFSDGRTAWQAAVEGENTEIMRLLIDKMPDIHVQFSNGRTAWQVAVEGGNIVFVTLLMGRITDINVQFIDGLSALHTATRSGNFDIVKLLVDNKADINAHTSNHTCQTALQIAAGNGHIDIVMHLLLNKADIDALQGVIRKGDNNFRCRTALQAAAGAGHIDMVTLLLDNKANINAPAGAHQGRTALQAAAGGGHIDIVKLLLDSNANVNGEAGEENGRTALQAAAGRGHMDVVRLLLVKNADVNCEAGMKGRTALQAAAEGGQINAVKLLLNSGANINAEAANFDGVTALQAAAGAGHIDVVKLLLDNNANVNSEAGMKGRTALQAAAEGGQINAVKLLLNSGANINAEAANFDGVTALQAAAGAGHIDVVKLLLDNNANVNGEAGNENGRTALQAAASGGHIDVVKLLLENEADINANPSHKGGMTAYEAADKGGHSSVLRLLIDNGAKRWRNPHWRNRGK